MVSALAKPPMGQLSALLVGSRGNKRSPNHSPALIRQRLRAVPTANRSGTLACQQSPGALAEPVDRGDFIAGYQSFHPHGQPAQGEVPRAHAVIETAPGEAKADYGSGLVAGSRTYTKYGRPNGPRDASGHAGTSPSADRPCLGPRIGNRFQRRSE